MSAARSILLVTVGGSHEPVVTAVRALSPDYVVFLCSEDNLATGRRGSYTQIEGAGNCIKAKPEDPRPTLPNIPAQAGLEAGRYRVERVSADDLDGAFASICRSIAQLAAEFPEARIVADYTGGTKTMTAALVAAALESERAELQLVTGSRADLVKVRAGTERPVLAGVERLRLSRAMALHLAAWSNYGYDVAARGLEKLPQPGDAGLRAKLNRACDLSKALAAWDRFDHAAALALLEPYAPVVAPAIPDQYAVLQLLAKSDSQRREGLQIWDLWLNALRRAAAGRYDDALARAYRMLEWTAQWILKRKAGLDTADLPPDKVRAELAVPNRDGKLQAGLFAAWQLVGMHTRGPAAQFFEAEREALRARLLARNASILAHGYSPIGAPGWDAMMSWLEERFLPMLREEIEALRPKGVFAQLPATYLWGSP